MKFIAFFVLMHCIGVLGAGTALNLPPWIVCKALAVGFKFGVIAIWLLTMWRLLRFFQRN